MVKPMDVSKENKDEELENGVDAQKEVVRQMLRQKKIRLRKWEMRQLRVKVVR